MSFLKNWSFSRKLMMVNAGYVLPCAVLIHFLIVDKNDQVEFNEKERMGVEFQRPLETLLNHVGEYKILLGHVIAGANQLTEKLDVARGQIDRDFAALDEVDQRLAEKLSFTEAALTSQKKEKAATLALKTQWQSIAERREGAPIQNVDVRLDKLIADIRLAISHVGDTSNLILDPDLDSYYMMDATVVALPQGQDRVQETTSFVRSLPLDRPLTEGEKIRLNVLGTMLKNDIDHVLGSVQTALGEDKNFQGISPSLQHEMPQALKEYVSVSETFTRNVFEYSLNPPSAKSQRDLFAAGDKAMDANFAFWSKAADELDKLLVVRIDAIKFSRVVALVLALLAWVPTVIVAALTVRRLNRSFINSVSKLESEAVMASTSSANLAAASQTVSSGSTEQAAAIQETGASMSEMASMVSRSSNQAVSSQELARKVKEQTEEGCRVMERMVHSMESIQGANAQLQNISNIISDISGKTNIINDIVGKTQLLSFNASIEAARAGQHGRGFAVVAEEVGNLAQTSGNAAKEIRNLIEDSRQQVEHILKSTLDRVAEGKSVTEQAQLIFAKIAKDISLISTQIESISEAAREQQFGIEQIAKAMNQMDQSTQTNNSAAHTAARLSDQLMSQSRKLALIARTVSALVLGNAGMNASAKRSEEGSDKPDSPSKAPGSMRDRLTTLSANGPEHSGNASMIAHLTSKDASATASIGNTPVVSADDESFKRAV